MKFYLNLFIFACVITNLKGETESCYNSNGDPIICEPSLINLAQPLLVNASSICGIKGSENICSEWIDKFGRIQTSCEKCDSSNQKSLYSVTDTHIRGKETCWISEGLPESKYPTTVNLTIGLKKRSSVAFITVELCGDNPDGIIIYKMDRGLKDWFPWQYFAKDCESTFGMPLMTQDMMATFSYNNPLKPVCFDLEKSIDYGGEEKIFRLIPFNPKQGRTFNEVLSKDEQDWLTATEIRISYVLMPKVYNGDVLLREKRNSEKSLYHFGSSDIMIGGQPLCHGHAFGVKKNQDNTYQCECQHSTTGKDCEKCHIEFNDQPWSPATFRNPAVCKRCECNNHSLKCNFDLNVYLKTGRIHGSNCIDCEDNTTGPQCDECAQGYFRQHAFPIYHRNACKPCMCHSVGSLYGKPCDKKTGKCFCKPGVTGKTCTHCAAGYKQTNSLKHPCKKISKLRHLVKSNDSDCNFCQKKNKRINFKRFCSKEINFKIIIKSRESRGEWIRFITEVEQVWRRKPNTEGSQFILENGEISSIWVNKDLVNCNCIDFEFGRSYLIMANVKIKEFMGQTELILNQSDVIEEWKNLWEEEFSQFYNQETMGKCNKFKRQKRHIRRRNLSASYNQYAIYT